MNVLSRHVARRIIETVGASGIPPEYGFQYFTAGLDPYLSVIDKEYLSTFIKEGGSSFKMVVGVYGGGKTHFLYCVRDIACKHGFAITYVSLKPDECPFHRLELVYKALVRGLIPPVTTPEELLSGYEQGIAAFLQSWYGKARTQFAARGLSPEVLRDEMINHIEGIQVESVSFARAVRAAFRAIMNKKEEEFADICQWLAGEGYDRRIHGRHGILQRIDRTTALPMMRSLVQWVREIGYSGLVVLLDEAERTPSLSQ